MIQEAQNLHFFYYLFLNLQTELKKTPHAEIYHKVESEHSIQCKVLLVDNRSSQLPFSAMVNFLLTRNLPKGGFKISSFFIKKDERFLACVLRFPQYFLYCIAQNHRQKAPQKTVSAIK